MAPTTPAGSPDSGGPADRSPALSAGERAEYELLRRRDRYATGGPASPAPRSFSC
ncbi:hypothetical protein RKD37_005277 [Streptomyces ambofaciens]|uniref:Uncharacterized protein n=1 Tax=Streptomyces calvus TaxID=67282 RepID=A0AA40VIM9_9ACTN|nr:hypothetical protein [Streptomyces calvus]GGP48324.1 hypothetical protein GCM10010247_21110 [Streptomyces calvus]